MTITELMQPQPTPINDGGAYSWGPLMFYEGETGELTASRCPIGVPSPFILSMPFGRRFRCVAAYPKRDERDGLWFWHSEWEEVK